MKRFRIHLLWLIPGLALFYCRTRTSADSQFESATAKDMTMISLATLDLVSPSWIDVDADLAHVYVGLTPREMALGVKRTFKNPRLPERLKALAELELPKIREKLNLESVLIELWPAQDGWGRVTWQVTRYRSRVNAPWVWLDIGHSNPRRGNYISQGTGLVFPSVMDPSDPNDRNAIFNQTPADVASSLDQGKSQDVGALYQHPAFESIVWTNSEMNKSYGAWQKYGTELKFYENCGKTSNCKAIYLQPPARFDDVPVAFVAKVNASGVTFDRDIEWQDENHAPAKSRTLVSLRGAISDGSKAKYKTYLNQLTGVAPIKGLDGTTIDFKKQSSFQKDNQLLLTKEFIASLARSWGYGSGGNLEVESQNFKWMGVDQSNLILRIRGKNTRNSMVVGSSHYDKAMSEDIYIDSHWKKLETTPGADDSISGVAMLLLAAEEFATRYKSTPPARTIELVFFTGEEFPAGTMGSRYYISQLLKNKVDVAANVNLDMNGYRNSGDPVFQISPGVSPESWALAETAYSIAMKNGGDWNPMVRFPLSKESFLGQTDGTIFDWMGYPTILINEHINMVKRDHPNYHQSTDLPKFIDVDYALAQYRVFVETLVRVAEDV